MKQRNAIDRDFAGFARSGDPAALGRVFDAAQARPMRIRIEADGYEPQTLELGGGPAAQPHVVFLHRAR